MRALTATLEAAQKQASGPPYIRAVFGDYEGEVSRLRFARHYSGSEGEYFAAVTVAPDGSLVRARIDPATKVLYTQRVASPGPASDYSQWTSHGTVIAGGAVALAASATSVFLYYVDADTLTLREKTSTDHGASYGAAATVATAAAAITYVAAAVAAGGDRLVLWSVGAAVWKARHSGGGWGAAAAWPNSAGALTGIATTYRFDWNGAVCGTESGSGDAKVWTAVYGDGGFQALDTWSALREVTTATAASNVSFRSPAVAFLQHWRLFFVEKYSGSVAYSRLYRSTMPSTIQFSQELWREPFAFDYGGDHGVAAAVGGAVLWLAAAAGVWSATVPSAPHLDVSADIVEAEVDLAEYDGRVRLVLRNDAAAGSSGAAGRYAGYGAGVLAALRRGARLELAPGYHTTAGAEASTGPAYWVEAVAQVTGAAATLVVEARDAWSLLEAWRARRQFTWAAGTKTVTQILQFICARAGFDYSGALASSAMTTLKPAFTVHPGENARSAVRRLLAAVPDEAVAEGILIGLRHPQAADASVYALGDGGHALVSALYNDRGAAVNRARVFGAGVIDEAFDFAEIDAVGERLTLVHDLNATTASQAADRAATALRDAEVRERADEVRLAGVSCGQELYDVVAVTDARAVLAGARRRVLGLRWRYSTRGEARYAMTLRLGSP